MFEDASDLSQSDDIDRTNGLTHYVSLSIEHLSFEYINRSTSIFLRHVSEYASAVFIPYLCIFTRILYMIYVHE